MGALSLKAKYKGFYGNFNRMRCTCTNWTLSALFLEIFELKSYQFQKQTPKVINISTF